MQADAGGALAQLRTHVANKISHMDCPYTKFLHTPFYCERFGESKGDFTLYVHKSESRYAQGYICVYVQCVISVYEKQLKWKVVYIAPARPILVCGDTA